MSMPQSKAVLLVDDETLFVKAACKLLERAGFQAVGASSLADARRSLASVQPSLMVLDVRLPDGSGLELLAELRGRAPAPPIVILTAFGDIEDAVLAMKLGAALSG